jgi:Cu+-exporting ATPase
MAMSSVSVVTNALRLRGFTRPASVQAILHPPFAERVRDYAYLVAIAAVALAVGAASLAFAQPDHAQGPTPSGSTPGSSSMNTQSITAPAAGHNAHAPAAAGQPAASAAPDGNTRVALVTPSALAPGQAAAVTYRLSDGQTGAPITDVVDSHERPMHLIAVSRDLQAFQHIHPLPTGIPGEYAVDATFPAAGTYYLFDEFLRATGETVVQRDTVTVDAPSEHAAALAVDLAPKTLGETRVALAGANTIRVGQEAVLTFNLSDARSGAPIRNLRPHLGAPAHGVILSEDAATFVHAHGEAVGAAGNGHADGGHDAPVPPPTSAPAAGGHDDDGHAHATPAGTIVGYGPEIVVRHTFTAPGLYKVWGQFQPHDGPVITADFVVQVAS